MRFAFRWVETLADQRARENNPQSEVEETLKRIEGHRDVIGYIIASADGVPLRSSFSEDKLKNEYARHMQELTERARSVVRDIKVTVE